MRPKFIELSPLENCLFYLQEEDDEVLEADMAIMDAEETKMLNSLTWLPLDEDILLFALAVVAPYQTMQNFKYKVKLTPGTGKRGKAAKSAIALFQVVLLIIFLYSMQKNC